MTAKKPNFNYALCMACNVCHEACPFSCIDMSKHGLDSHNKCYPELALPEKCTGCALCQKACPVDAINM
jgi:formate hydrogenlyase subunit 6/NADH:ubiquinone oxidoreductase subunit I